MSEKVVGRNGRKNKLCLRSVGAMSKRANERDWEGVKYDINKRQTNKGEGGP